MSNLAKTGEQNTTLRLVAIGSPVPRELPLASRRLGIGTLGDNDFVLPEKGVSRKHALIRKRFGRYVIRDLGSTNGTFVNGRRVHGYQPLKPGDEVAFGAVRFVVASRKRARSPILLYARLGIGSIVLVAVAYLGFEFVTNWSLLEDLATAPAASPQPSASLHTLAQATPLPSPLAAEARTTGERSKITSLPASRLPVAEAPHPETTPPRYAHIKASRSAGARETATASTGPAGEVFGSIEEYIKAGRSPATPPIEFPGAVARRPEASIGPSEDLPVVLRTLNHYRASVNLSPVSEDPKLSDGDRKHSAYLVKNYADRINHSHLIGGEMHSEEPANQWYTKEGSAAGAHSNVSYAFDMPAAPPPEWALSIWMAEPFHRLSLLNPGLYRVGYGQLCDAEKHFCGAALNAIDDAALSYVGQSTPLRQPIEFPAEKVPFGILELRSEWPNPITSCPGYSMPVGTPVTLQMGAQVEANLSSYSFACDDKTLDACGFDWTSYSNPVASEQGLARQIMHAYGAVVIVPRLPLDAGARYQVAAIVNGQEYKWSFTTSNDGKSADGSEFRHQYRP